MSDWVVRKANETDKEWLVEQVRAFLQFMGNVVPFNGPHIAQLVSVFIAQHWSLVVEKGGEKCGAVFATVQPHFLNPDVRVFTEVMWWVPEEKRKSKAGLLLLNAMEMIADAEECSLVVLSTEAHSPISGKSLSKRGFRQFELAWLKEQ